MNIIQCVHPPHHHNGFMVTCCLWMANGGVHALSVLEPLYYCIIHIYDATIYVLCSTIYRERDKVLQILIEDLKHPKTLKSISNSTVSHLVSCCLIPRPATMKG